MWTEIKKVAQLGFNIHFPDFFLLLLSLQWTFFPSGVSLGWWWRISPGRLCRLLTQNCLKIYCFSKKVLGSDQITVFATESLEHCILFQLVCSCWLFWSCQSFLKDAIRNDCWSTDVYKYVYKQIYLNIQTW